MSNYCIDTSLMSFEYNEYYEKQEVILENMDLFLEFLLKATDSEDNCINVFISYNELEKILCNFPYDFSSRCPDFEVQIKVFLRLIDDLKASGRLVCIDEPSDEMCVDLSKANIMLNELFTSSKNITNLEKALTEAWSCIDVEAILLPHRQEFINISIDGIVKEIFGVYSIEGIERTFRTFEASEKHEKVKCENVLKKLVPHKYRNDIYSYAELGKTIDDQGMPSPLLSSCEVCKNVINRAIKIDGKEVLFYKINDYYLLFRFTDLENKIYHAYNEFYSNNIPEKVNQYFYERME